MRPRLKDILTSVSFIVLIAFVVRLGFFYDFYEKYLKLAINGRVPLGIYGEAGSIARAIAAGRGFSSPLQKHPTGPTVWLTPIFPYLLAGVFKLFGTFTYASDIVIHTINLALSAFTCWPIFTIGKKAFGQTTGKFAAWAWAFCPTAIYFPVWWVWDTSLAALWMAMLVAATLLLRGSDKPSYWAGYGALWAVGAMINPSLLSVLPVLALWAIWPVRQRLGQAAQLGALASFIFMAGCAPWAIRNYIDFHKFIPFRSNFALELWLGNNPDVHDTWADGLHPNENDTEAAKYVSMTEIPYMAEKHRLALEFMRTHPRYEAYLFFRRFEETWLGIWDAPADLWRHSPLYVKAILLWTVLFSLLSLLGVLCAYRAENPTALPFALMMLIFPLLFYVTHPAMRYRYPLDPVMQVLAVYAVVYPLSKLSERRAPELATPLHNPAD